MKIFFLLAKGFVDFVYFISVMKFEGVEELKIYLFFIFSKEYFFNGKFKFGSVLWKYRPRKIIVNKKNTNPDKKEKLDSRF